MFPRHVAACIVFLLAWCSAGWGQPPSEEAISSAADAQSVAIEDEPAELDPITVTAERTKARVRREMFDTQRQVYRSFNELNTDDDYDMICRLETHPGSQILHRVCKARFHRNAESEASSEFMDDGLYHLNRAELDRQYQHQREIMADLANTHPGFLALLQKRLALRREFEAKGGKVRHGVNSDP